MATLETRSIDEAMFDSFRKVAERERSGKGLRLVVRNLGGGDHFSIKVSRSESAKGNDRFPSSRVEVSSR